jgi:hypothetical protein
MAIPGLHIYTIICPTNTIEKISIMEISKKLMTKLITFTKIIILISIFDFLFLKNLVD